MRPFRTNAGLPVIASSMRCTPGPDLLRRRAAAPGDVVLRRSRQVEEVRSLGLVELKRPGERLEDFSETPLALPRSRRV